MSRNKNETASAEMLLYFSRLIQGRWIDGLILIIGAFAFFSTVVIMLRLVEAVTEFGRWAIGAGLLLIAGLTLYLIRHHIVKSLKYTASILLPISIMKIFAIGLFLRILWMVVFPAKASSDGAVYLSLAKGILENNSYEIAGTYAYWPPGYPFILAIWQTIIPGEGAGYLILNLVLFFVMFWGVVRLTAELGGQSASRWAGIALSLWPNYVTSSATPEKELVVAALLPWCAFFLIRIVLDSKVAMWQAFSCGLFLGVSTLVQPSLQLLVPAGVMLIVISRSQYVVKRLYFAVFLIIGVSIVILPWTYRNYTVFGDVVLVSSNGGSNLYRANNALANGGYTERGEIDLSKLEEVVQDKEGKRLAKEWITGHPIDFAKLAFEKQMRFLGDDATGIYTTLKVGEASSSTSAYIALKTAANFWWMIAWLLIIFLITSKRSKTLQPLARIPIWFFLYLFFLHSIFESAGKYHLPVLWVLPYMLAIYLSPQDGSSI